MTIVANRLTALIEHTVNQVVQRNRHVLQTRTQNLCTIFPKGQGRILLRKSLANHGKTTVPKEEVHSLANVFIYERLILNSKGHRLDPSLSLFSPWWRQSFNNNAVRCLIRAYFSNQSTLLKSFDRKKIFQTTITRNACKKSKCGKVAKKKKSGCPKKKKCKAKKKPSFKCKKRIPCIKKLKKKKSKKHKKRKKGKKSKCKPKSTCGKKKKPKKKKKVKDCKKVVKKKPPVCKKKKKKPKKADKCKKKKKQPCGVQKKKKKCAPKKKKCASKKKKVVAKKKKCGPKKKKCGPKKKKSGPKKKCGAKKKKCPSKGGSKTKCSATGSGSTSKQAQNPACGGKCVKGDEPDLVCKRANSGVSQTQAPAKKVRICSKTSNKYPKSRGYCFPRN